MFSRVANTFELLIEKGAEVNTSGVGKYESPLQAAAYHNRKFVELLLHAMVPTPTSKMKKYGSLLKGARKKSYRTEMMLLKYDAIKD